MKQVEPKDGIYLEQNNHIDMEVKQAKGNLICILCTNPYESKDMKGIHTIITTML